MARSERDLTKVTKVRVRPNTLTKDEIGSTNSMNSTTSNSVLKPRPKMKTTTMIINDASLPANHSQDVLHHRSMYHHPTQIGNFWFQMPIRSRYQILAQFLQILKMFILISDVVHEPLDWKLVEQTNMALQQASDNLVQLYKRISLDHSLQENMRIQFLQKLVITADIAQQTLRPINPGSQSIMPNNMVKVIVLIENFMKCT